MRVFKCTWCGKHLSEAGDIRQPRSDKRFCCDKHRVAYHRWFKRVTVLAQRSQDHVSTLGMYLDHPQAQEAAVLALRRLIEMATAELREHGVKVVR